MSGTEAAPGASIGLPAEGRGSLASWGKRIGALIIDWGASMVLASAIFGPVVIRGGGWPMWMPMAVFFVESVLLTACLLYTSPSPRDQRGSRMPSSA